MIDLSIKEESSEEAWIIDSNIKYRYRFEHKDPSSEGTSHDNVTDEHTFYNNYPEISF